MSRKIFRPSCKDSRYTRHRSPWYSQEDRSPSQFICTYIGRNTTKKKSPFRFILNHSQATVSNSYLILYPLPELKRQLEEEPDLAPLIWQALKDISPRRLLGEGRVYGGGLHKLEPKELSNVPADRLEKILPAVQFKARQMRLLEEPGEYQVSENPDSGSRKRYFY